VLLCIIDYLSAFPVPLLAPLRRPFDSPPPCTLGDLAMRAIEVYSFRGGLTDSVPVSVAFFVTVPANET